MKRQGGMALLALLAPMLVTLVGCRVPPIKSSATTTAAKLPDKVPDLIKYADDLMTKANANPSPDTSDMENALVALDKASSLDPHSYEAAWKAARACAWLADDQYDDKTKRTHFSARGIDYAKAAIALSPKSVEGHLYSGINLGLQATTKLVGAKFMVPSVRDAAKKAMQIDAGYDRGGAPRLLGSLYAEAPPWPASIGDPDKGVDLLELALKAPGGAEWPQNDLLLANALVKAEKYDEAKRHYEAVLAAQPTPNDAHQLPKWKQKAKHGLEDAAKKQSAGAS